ncbi:hypothetical protein FRB91_000728 [Serendipita sp. 411]|nr:hypothetical protein FRB91_000728 [Serendipita sp. 411]
MKYSFCMMTSLCEMATFLPHKKGFVGLVTRYVHPAVGFGLGWTYLCQFMFVPPSHINTAAIVMTYINNTIDINGNAVESRNPVPSWAWRLIFIFIVTSVNFLGIRSFGRLELLLSSFKILVLIALIIFGLVVDLGGARLITGGFDPIHGRNWRPPFGPMGHGLSNEVNPGSAGQFLGFWATMVRVLFAFEGIELIGVVIGEAANPRRNVPRAIKQTYTLVIGLYVITIIIIGLICPSNSPTLTNRILSHEGQVSPFIVAAHLLAAKALVPVINAAIIVFALSGTISNLYTGSRTLYGLALDKQAPKILRRVTVGGRPLLALSLCVIWCFLSYLGQNEKRPNYTFDYFVDLTTTAGSVSWICIFWAHIRFRKALKLQGINLRELTYLAPLHPYGTWFSLVASTIFTIFKGHESFVKRRAGGFITAYILIAFFAVLIAGWKFYHPEDHFVNLGRVDLQEGGRDQDLALEERQQLEQDQEHQRQEQHGNGLRRRTNLPWLMGERNGDTP